MGNIKTVEFELTPEIEEEFVNGNGNDEPKEGEEHE